MQPRSDSAKGVIVSLSASCLFGLMYYYATMLTPLNGMEIFGWRVLSTLPFLTVFMRRAGFWRHVADIFERAKGSKPFGAFLVLSSALIGVQFWLFLWAPVNGMALAVSLGYLLMPLVMVVFGRVLFQDQLLPYQKIAVVFAVLGVGNQVWQVGSLSWAVVLVAVGFPVYFSLRRRMGTDNLGGLWFDMVFMVPAALFAIHTGESGFSVIFDVPRMLAMVALLGVMSATSVGCYIMASRYLSLSLFGLLSYVEPVLLVVVSLILGERIADGEVLTYVGVGLAVATLAFGGMRGVRLRVRG